MEFNQLAPPKELTNPENAPIGEYPRHVHKFAGLEADGSPKLNDYLVVHNDKEKQAALKAGYSLTPVLDAAVERA